MTDPAAPPEALAPLQDMTAEPTGETEAPPVSIIVVSYNTREMTLDCLRSLAAETRTPYELIVVDNASSDGSAAAIAAAFPEARLIASDENLGFAKANNLAAREARGRYLLLLNPDTVTLERAVDRLLAFADRTPEARIWGGRTLYADRSLNPGSCNGLLTLWGVFCRTSGLASAFAASPVFNPDEYGGWDRSTEREVGYVCGCFFLIERAFWNELGGFDLSFVMYGEETDLCHRARARGARPRVTPDATIVHYVGASSTRRSNKEALVLKAQLTLVERHLPGWRKRPALFLLRVKPLLRKLGGEAAAKLTRSARARAVAQHWGDVWRDRASWRNGFPPLPHPQPAPGSKLGSKPGSKPGSPPGPAATLAP